MEFSSNYSQPKHIEEYEDIEATNISYKESRGKSLPKQLPIKERHFLNSAMKTKTVPYNINRTITINSKGGSKIKLKSTKSQTK